MANPVELFESAQRCHRSGDFAGAEGLYRQVLEIDPRHAATHHQLGIMAHLGGNSSAAVALVRQAIALAPEEPGYHFTLGVLLAGQGQMEAALACYRATLQRDPRHAPALNNLGNALDSQGQLADAEACFRAALRCDPCNANAHFNLGNTLREQGRRDEAIACYWRALQVRSDHAGARQNLTILRAHAANERYSNSVALMSMGRYREALAEAENACRSAHDDANLVCQRARARVLLGDIDRGRQDYERALRLNPNHEAARSGLDQLRLLVSSTLPAG